MISLPILATYGGDAQSAHFMNDQMMRMLRVSAQDGVQEIHDAGLRAAALTRQLLAFSRHQVLEPSVVNLNDVITGMDKMLQRVIGENIDLVSTTAADLGAVRVDVASIEQVIMNLVVNARDATV